MTEKPTPSDAAQVNVFQVVAINGIATGAGLVMLLLIGFSLTGAYLGAMVFGTSATLAVLFCRVVLFSRPAVNAVTDGQAEAFMQWTEDALDDAWMEVAARSAPSDASRDEETGAQRRVGSVPAGR